MGANKHEIEIVLFKTKKRFVRHTTKTVVLHVILPLLYAGIELHARMVLPQYRGRCSGDIGRFTNVYNTETPLVTSRAMLWSYFTFLWKIIKIHVFLTNITHFPTSLRRPPGISCLRASPWSPQEPWAVLVLPSWFLGGLWFNFPNFLELRVFIGKHARYLH